MRSVGVGAILGVFARVDVLVKVLVSGVSGDD